MGPSVKSNNSIATKIGAKTFYILLHSTHDLTPKNGQKSEPTRKCGRNLLKMPR